MRTATGGFEWSRDCRSLVWFTEEASGVSEAMVPVRVLGFRATDPWVWGSILQGHSPPFPFLLAP